MSGEAVGLSHSADSMPRGSPEAHPAARWHTGFTREHGFLLDVLSAEQLPVRVPPGLDWRHLLRICPDELHSYLGVRIAQLQLSDCCPSDLLDHFRNARRAAAAMSLRYLQQLRSLSTDFSGSGVEFVVLKGIPLATLAYGSADLRPMSDMDIVVQRDDYQRALQLLTERGFRYPAHFVDRHPLRTINRAINSHAEMERLFPLELPGTAVRIDLHTQFHMAEPLFRLRAIDVWSRTRRVSVDGLELRVLDPSDFLIDLAMHAAERHGFLFGLRNLVDINLYVRRVSQDWEEISSRCVQAGCAKWMHLAMTLARALLRTPIPQAFLDSLGPQPDPEELLPFFNRQIWADRHVQYTLGLSELLSNGSAKEILRVAVRRASFAPRQAGDRLISAPEAQKRNRIAVVFSDLRRSFARYARSFLQGSLSLGSIVHYAGQFQQLRKIEKLMEMRDKPSTAK